jgi:hypothetical protein
MRLRGAMANTDVQAIVKIVWEEAPKSVMYYSELRIVKGLLRIIYNRLQSYGESREMLAQIQTEIDKITKLTK